MFFGGLQRKKVFFPEGLDSFFIGGFCFDTAVIPVGPVGGFCVCA